MKYIRTTENKICETKRLKKCDDPRFPNGWFTERGVPLVSVKESEKVEDLCDYYIVFDNEGYCSVTQEYDYFIELYVDLIRHCRFGGAYGAIRTKKGLIYVAEKDRIRDDWKLL